MPQKNDPVPCFFSGQADWERPCQVVTRAEARDLKKLLLGKFENHGRTFRLHQVVAETVQAFIDGPFGIGNLLPFSKSQNKLMAPEHLHYSVPACGAHKHGTSPAYFWRQPTAEPVLVEAFS